MSGSTGLCCASDHEAPDASGHDLRGFGPLRCRPDSGWQRPVVATGASGQLNPSGSKIPFLLYHTRATMNSSLCIHLVGTQVTRAAYIAQSYPRLHLHRRTHTHLAQSSSTAPPPHHACATVSMPPCSCHHACAATVVLDFFTSVTTRCSIAGLLCAIELSIQAPATLALGVTLPIPSGAL